MISRKDQGFTAVELLITLFVAAAFLIAAYQLFNVVIRDGGLARGESRAGNVAYDYLRRYAATTTNPCTPSTPLNNYGISVEGLTSASITVDITCPYPATVTMSRIEATLTFNSPQEVVKYSTYSYGESGEDTTEVLEGLVGWWPLNGNANTSVGTINGIEVNVSSTTGQNGQPNNAYSFTGTNSYINLSTSSTFNSPELTMSAWVRPTSLTGSPTILAKELSYKYRLLSGLNGLASITGGAWTVSQSYSAPAITVNNWSHVVMTVSSTANVVKLYANGSLLGSIALGGTITGYSSQPLIAGAYNTSGGEGLTGSLDDLRFYNRALADAEIQTLYTNGAK